MDPSLMVSFMANQAQHQLVEHRAARGWMAEQAAKNGKTQELEGATVLKRVIAAIIERQRQVVRDATTIDLPANPSSPRLDRVG
jgi:hypothetical protein